MSESTVAAPQQRIGDDERERAVARLGEHVGAGRLDLAEFETRTTMAYAARTRADLDELFTDLPRQRSQGRPDPRRVHRTVLTAVWTPWLTSSAVCMVIWLTIALAQGTPGYFWPIWVIGPWGVVLAVGTVVSGRACGHRHAG